MGKHEPMTAKAIAIKIKSKGLQKIKYYCEMCKKQCRDDNGFKCHIMSESHQRQALIVSENPEKFVSDFSKKFMEGFMYILKTRYRSKRVLANTVFQEYIKERDHIHMNGTRWTTLTEFAHWLGENDMCKIDDSERGVLVTYIDRDPETIKRQELDAKRAQQAREAAERNQKEIERQMEATKRLYEQMETKKLEAQPIPIIKVPLSEDPSVSGSTSHGSAPSDRPIPDELHPDVRTHEPTSPSDKELDAVVERPLFGVQAITIARPASTSYKPPPPKRKKARLL